MQGKFAIHAFFDESTNTVSYIVADPVTKEAAFIDPVLDYDPGASVSYLTIPVKFKNAAAALS
jgi:hypothetical protein